MAGRTEADTNALNVNQPHLLHVFDPPLRRLEVVTAASTYESHADANATVWHDLKAQLGEKLFDGPMCRFEGFDPTPARPVLRVSRTSYRIFVETNLYGPPTLPDAALARPIGVSVALETSDGHLALGRRGSGVAYYPNRVHPFAGSLEWPADGEPIDPFADVRRELAEELDLAADEVVDLRLTGICEDRALRHPELTFAASTIATLAELRHRLDAAEHDAIFAVPLTPADIETVIANEELTPVARAAVGLFARNRFRVKSRIGPGDAQGV